MTTSSRPEVVPTHMTDLADRHFGKEGRHKKIKEIVLSTLSYRWQFFCFP